MTENPAASAAAEEPPPAAARNPMPWLLVGVLIALFAVLGYAVVMVVGMLA